MFVNTSPTLGKKENILSHLLYKALLWQQEKICPGKISPHVELFGLLIPTSTTGEASTHNGRDSCASEPVQKNDVEERNFEKKKTVSVINRMCILLSPKQQFTLTIHWALMHY
jgi:hypothetical protein